MNVILLNRTFPNFLMERLAHFVIGDQRDGCVSLRSCLFCCKKIRAKNFSYSEEHTKSISLVKTKEIGLVMTRTESGLRRCGPVCGVRECEVQGLVQRTELCGVRKVCAEHGDRYGDWRLVRRYGIEEWVRGVGEPWLQLIGCALTTRTVALI